jgi:hypothetical protein
MSKLTYSITQKLNIMQNFKRFTAILFFTAGFLSCSKENVKSQSQSNVTVQNDVSRIRVPVPVKSIPFYFKVWNNDNQEFDLQRMKVKVWYTDVLNSNGWLQEFENDYSNMRFNIQDNVASPFYNRTPAFMLEVLPAGYNALTGEVQINIQYDRLALMEVEFLPRYLNNNEFYEWGYVHFTSTGYEENHIIINHYFDCP